MEFGGLSVDKLESWFNERNDEIKSIGNTFDSFKRQFEKWKIGDEFTRHFCVCNASGFLDER